MQHQLQSSLLATMPALAKEQVEDLETTDSGSGGSDAETSYCSSASCSGSESSDPAPVPSTPRRGRLQRPSFAPTKSLRLPGARHFRGTPLPVIPSTPATKPGTWGCDDLSSEEEEDEELQGFQHFFAAAAGSGSGPPPPPLTPAPAADNHMAPPSPPAWDSSGFELTACPPGLTLPPGIAAPVLGQLRGPPGLPAPPPGLAPPALPAMSPPSAPAWESCVRQSVPAPPQQPPSITSTIPPSSARQSKPSVPAPPPRQPPSITSTTPPETARQCMPPAWDASASRARGDASSRDASSRDASARHSTPSAPGLAMDSKFCYSPMPMSAGANTVSKVPAAR